KVVIHCFLIMVDTEKRAVGCGATSTIDLSGKNKENEKKKRSCVKLVMADVKKQVDGAEKYVDNRLPPQELLPKKVTHDWLERVFTKCENVVYVSMPRYKTTGHSKGFAFIEFETEEEAQKAVEMLNNPPEDAPWKPGIFPKTKNRKPIPDPPSLNTTQGGKRKHTAEFAEGVAPAEGTGKPPSRKLEKKRRRSQTGESSESDAQGDMPSKLRKTSEDDMVEKEEKMEDFLLKAKRTRKKKHKERVKIREEVIPLRVLSKKDWLKQEYMTLQKRSMGALKTCLTKFHHKGAGGKMDTSLQQTFCVCPLVYVDAIEGDAEGYVRFKSPVEAKAIIDARTGLQNKHSRQLEILSGDHEQRYWQKILVDRQAKLNRPRNKKRGTEKIRFPSILIYMDYLISKAEKIIIARDRRPLNTSASWRTDQDCQVLLCVLSFLNHFLP
uniref:RRM domain-containing protein n=1 Tax=Oncorhynchus mykiss TaxID=8022 RepID=A0A8C7NND5_ONCMY